MEINIDTTNSIIGRVATYSAKQALLGNTVNLFNCEKAIMSGTKAKEKYHYIMRDIGRPGKGPNIPRMPDRFVRRIIRGMLSHRKQRGKEAYKRIMCYIGVPEKHKDKKLQKIQGTHMEKLPELKYETIQQICKHIGGKV